MASPRDRTGAPAKPQAHRYRVSVPAADEAVVAWMELQDNPSLSVRMLIRESIERLGYIDVVNRPVAQIPGGGRTAATEGTTAREAEPVKPVPAPLPSEPTAAPQPRRTAPKATPAPPAPAAPSDGPMDINDIFAMTR